jgi:hypothetical protein
LPDLPRFENHFPDISVPNDDLREAYCPIRNPRDKAELGEVK